MAQDILGLCGIAPYGPTLARTPQAAHRKWAMLAAACGQWGTLAHGQAPRTAPAQTLRKNRPLAHRLPRGACYGWQY